jgi:hypothetical protein
VTLGGGGSFDFTTQGVLDYDLGADRPAGSDTFVTVTVESQYTTGGTAQTPTGND